jgi:hypothetical protein
MAFISFIPSQVRGEGQVCNINLQAKLLFNITVLRDPVVNKKKHNTVIMNMDEQLLVSESVSRRRTVGHISTLNLTK